jgi:hypothetical protein
VIIGAFLARKKIKMRGLKQAASVQKIHTAYSMQDSA